MIPASPAPRAARLLAIGLLLMAGQASAATELPSILPAPARMQALDGGYTPAAKPRIALAPYDREMRELGKLAKDIVEANWKAPASLTPPSVW